MSAVLAGAARENVGPGLAGFLVMFVLAVATVFLVRSMVGHLRKVRHSADPSAGVRPPGVEPPAGSSRPQAPQQHREQDGGQPPA